MQYQQPPGYAASEPGLPRSPRIYEFHAQTQSMVVLLGSMLFLMKTQEFNFR